MRNSGFVLALIMSLFLLSNALAGTVSGKISFSGAKPSLPKIKMNADPKCVKMHGGKDVDAEAVVINGNGTLKNVFIYVKSGLAAGGKYPIPANTVTFDQQGCTYHPHVLGMMVGQKIEIKNSDPTLHNVHSLAKNTKGFNVAQPKQGMKMQQVFEKPEVMVKVKCEVHNWMSAYIGVLDNPFFAVSDDKGSFEIKNLPAGTYEIEAWHEKFGTKTMKLTVGASDTKTADFSFSGN